MNLTKTLAGMAEAMTPIVRTRTPAGELRFRCASPDAAKMAGRFQIWEPETLAWLDAIPAGERLWDIGANIGVFSIYAAKKGLKVDAFEPGAASYAELNHHIVLNAVEVSAYGFALSDTVGLSALHMTDTAAGGALHSVGVRENVRGGFTPVYSQPIVTMTVDHAVALGIPAPDHVKLDVDSIEDKILAGAAATLRSVKSLLIEVEQERPEAWRQKIFGLLGEAGLEPVDDNRNVLFRRSS